MKKIAYVTSCFGALSHTFIRRELSELKNQGVEVVLYGIRSSISPYLSQEERELIQETHYVYPLKLVSLFLSNLRFLFRHPLRYSRVFLAAFFNEELRPLQHLKLIYHFFVSAALAQDMSSRQVTHIHSHFLNVPTTLAMYAADLLGRSFSFTNHTGSPQGLPDMIGLRRKLRKATKVITISEQSARSLNAIVPCQEKTVVIHCGIDSNEFVFSERRKRSWGSSPVKLLCVGRMVDFKGFEFALEALKLLDSDSRRFTLSFVGDGPLRGSLASQTEQLSLSQEVNFLGALSSQEVKKAMDQHDILLVPSITTARGKMEGLPVVIMEAMAMGLPVIASRSAGIPEIVLDGLTGLLSTSGDPKSLADCVRRLDQDVALRERCIAAAAQLVQKDFDLRTLSKAKSAVLQGMIDA